LFKSFFKYVLTVGCIINASISFSQNWVNVTSDYIKNPSFEDYDTCMASVSNLAYCTGWSPPTAGTADWFHTCMNGNTGPNDIVPNGAGYLFYQSPFHGNAFIGLYAYDRQYLDSVTTYEYREYAESKLIMPLKPNALYRLSFRMSMSDKIWGAKVKCIGAYFHPNAINNSDFAPIQVNAQICSPDYIDDTLNWTMVSGIFRANGNEEYITLGNFTDSTDVLGNIPWGDTSVAWQFQGETYIVIDSLILEMKESNYIILPNVFTPNNDGINDQINFNEAYGINKFNLKVYNRWGSIVFESNDYTKPFTGKNDFGNNLQDGVYYYVLEALYNDKYEQQLKGFIQLIR
jgi:gliding motility-associated-like protein